MVFDCTNTDTKVLWMDNEVGYMCTVCRTVFGPWDYGWPPECNCTEEADKADDL